MPGDGEMNEALPTQGGAYVFVMRGERAFGGRIGALGVLQFAPGYYCYVGSARKGIRARVSRHLRPGRKRRHWHVDYLRPHCRPVGVLAWTGPAAEECALNRLVADRSAESVVGFGCSDCACSSHLHFTTEHPGERLRAALPAGALWVNLNGGPG